MRFLHTADVHLKDLNHLENLKLVLSTAIRENCDVILISGDLFDKDSSYLSLEGELVGVLESFPGKIYVIPGNHDINFLAKRKNLSENTIVLNPEKGFDIIEVNDIQLIPVPYRDDRELKDLGDIPADPDRAVLMVHGAFYSNEFFYSTDQRKSYFPIFIEDVQDKFRYVALGHYHRLINDKYGRTYVVNPGSPRITKSSDMGERLVSVVDTHGWKVNIIPLPVPFNYAVKVHVNPGDDGDNILSKLEKELSFITNEELRQLAQLQIHIRGTLSPDITSPQSLLSVMQDYLNRRKYQYRETIDMSGLHQIFPGLLDNQYVNNLLDELKFQAETQQIDWDEVKLTAIERINAIFIK